MKKNSRLDKLDFLFICAVAILFLSCVATTYHTAETLNPGQGSLSPGYMQIRSTEEFAETPVQLLGASARIGASKRFEFGAEHVLDISKDNDNSFGSIWGDFKVQLTNKDKLIRKPILSTGLMKGYAYHSDANVHITTLPVLFSLKPTDRFSPTFLYRLEYISESFVPSTLENPRHTFALGFEYCLRDPSPDKWDPKLALSIGTLNSLGGDPEESSLLFFNLGFKINTPYKVK
jgi:hypothetical protein